MNKKLDKMSVTELGELFPIILSEHKSNWKTIFESEKEKINNIFNKNEIYKIEHIGSTAIPNIISKPTIDIILQITKNIDKKTIIKNLEKINYHFIAKPENPPPNMMFVKGYTDKGFKGQAYHIHIRFKGDCDELYFRDYLKENTEKAIEYENLKIKLAKKYKFNREKYTNGKTKFVKKITKEAKKN